jgi:hypothetical protein
VQHGSRRDRGVLTAARGPGNTRSTLLLLVQRSAETTVSTSEEQLMSDVDGTKVSEVAPADDDRHTALLRRRISELEETIRRLEGSGAARRRRLESHWTSHSGPSPNDTRPPPWVKFRHCARRERCGAYRGGQRCSRPWHRVPSGRRRGTSMQARVESRSNNDAQDPPEPHWGQVGGSSRSTVWPIDGLAVPVLVLSNGDLVDCNRAWCDSAWCAMPGMDAGRWIDAVDGHDRPALIQRICAGDERAPAPIRMIDGSVHLVHVRRLRS